jgi:hypothetical protein
MSVLSFVLFIVKMYKIVPNAARIKGGEVPKDVVKKVATKHR